jgi:hypothetical protein
VTKIFEIDEKTFDRVLYVQDHKDNRAAVDVVSKMLVMDLQVTFRPGSDADHFDAVFKITGKTPRKVAARYVLVPYSRSEVHPFVRGEYYFAGAPW